ncbi:hypothetical protein U1Q18_040022 [Sarracenia purpurea var. burkii]
MERTLFPEPKTHGKYALAEEIHGCTAWKHPSIVPFHSRCDAPETMHTQSLKAIRLGIKGSHGDYGNRLQPPFARFASRGQVS